MPADDLLSGGASNDWGDDADYPLDDGIPPQEVKHNADGTKTILDYGMSDDGYLSKTITVMKVQTVTKTVSKSVAARKKWSKFGDCAGKGPGLEANISTVSPDEIQLDWLDQNENDEEQDEDEDFAEQAAKDIQTHLKMERFRRRHEERKLGLSNWAQMMSMEAAAKDPKQAAAAGLRSEVGAAGKYVPPSKRGGASASSGGETMYSRDDSATVRISNVSRSTEEADLDELCKPFGSIKRIFLSRDRETGESKGFAFVAFQSSSDAAKCIERLNGYGYDHLILSVEWSKPKEPRDGDSSRGGFGR